jgi:hypothetical protein
MGRRNQTVEKAIRLTIRQRMKAMEYFPVRSNRIPAMTGPAALLMALVNTAKE